MPRILRIAILLLLLTGLGSSPAGATSVPGCINPYDSALNQYCEVVPAATGGQTPKAGAPGLATALPSRVEQRIEHADVPQAQGKARRALLRLPAPVALARSGPASTSVAKTNAPTLPLSLILVLAGLAALLFAAAVARRRRRGADPHAPA